MSKAIELIRKVLLDSRETHKHWLGFYEKHPEGEAKYKDGAGDKEHQLECIQRYDKALKALAELEKDQEDDLKAKNKLLEERHFRQTLFLNR